ncbi:hypothetical protein ACS0TY_015506 [Phlomoides rotata]
MAATPRSNSRNSDNIEKGFSFRVYTVSWANVIVEIAFFSMQTYLTDVWRLSFTHAAAILNIWGGISKILPVFFLFLADALLGRFKINVIANIACSVGIAFITMSTPPVLPKPMGMCKEYDARCIGDAQKVLFYTGMALLALGRGGHRASLDPFLEEQHYSIRDMSQLSWTCIFIRIPIYLFLPIVLIAGFFAIPYVKQWFLLFGVPGICVASATLIFLSGWNTYNYSEPQGSPLSVVCRVFVAAVRKISQPFPADTNQIYKKDDDEGDYSFPPGNTFFVEQGSHMNRNFGKWKVPSQLLLVVFFMGKIVFSTPADRLLLKFSQLQGIAVALPFSILSCVTASGIEIERLKVVRHHGLVNEPDEVVPLNAYWLFFRLSFSVLVGLDSFLGRSLDAFYRMESPKVMIGDFKHFADAVSGLGLMYSVPFVYVVEKMSEIGGRQSWFQDYKNKLNLKLCVIMSI